MHGSVRGVRLGRMASVAMRRNSTTTLTNGKPFSVIVTGVGHGVLLGSVGRCVTYVRPNSRLCVDKFCMSSVPMVHRRTRQGKLDFIRRGRGGH